MNDNIKSAIDDLSKADSRVLYEKLGAYASAFPQDPAKFASAQAAGTMEVAFAGPMEDAAELGKKILRRWNKMLYELVCGGDSVDPEARSKIMGAIKLNDSTAIAAAITGILISAFSVGPAIATVVGVLLGKILLPAAGQEICSFWKDRV
jgi:hypothetical protein